VAEIDSEAADAKQRELRGVLPAGSRLRSYELTSVLGQGAFGSPTGRAIRRWAATSPSRNICRPRWRCAKAARRSCRARRNWPRSSSGARALSRRARTLATLSRAPAVVRVHDFLEANGTAYIVMELALGETLDQRLRRAGPLPPPSIERILHPLLDGLQRVHGVGFLHRDIKPANIVLDDEGAPTLIDFGAARAAMAGRSTALTAIFTPGYAAAEQFTSANQGPWTDIYGLSATLYHSITGARAQRHRTHARRQV